VFDIFCTFVQLNIKKLTIMATAIKSQSFGSARTQTVSVPAPKRLSKAGEWMRDHPSGICTVIDWRAVNK